MEFKIDRPDPLGILRSTKKVVETAKFVSIKNENIDKISNRIKERFEKGIGSQEIGVSPIENMENSLQLLFLEDVVNFCFWPDEGTPKWQVETIDEKITSGGWYSLQACFERGLKNRIPILDAHYLSSIFLEDGSQFFKGINNVQIPLLQERVNNLREAGRILADKFNGKFINVIHAADYDAIKLAKLIIEKFPSFRDVSVLDGKKIFFYKRAQIVAQDISYIFRSLEKQLTNLEQLTAFADYKLPQILRMYGVLEYEKNLVERIDNYVQILHDSREEIEIRSATIWSVELLRCYLPNMTIANIDNTIWIISQDVQGEARPYHRTRTIYY